jgi:hypothetical protein
MQQHVQVQWKGDSIVYLQFVQPVGNGMAQRVIKTVFWNKQEQCADYMDGEMQQGREVRIN